MNGKNVSNKSFGDRLVIRDFFTEGNRSLFLDAFKGFAIFCMIFVNTTSHFENIPWWLTHAAYNSSIIMTFPDLIPPMFLFAIAITLQPQLFRAIKSKGFFDGVMKYITRFFSYIGLGMIYSFSIVDGSIVFTWGVLQSIGMASLICLIFVGFHWKKRLISGILFLILYQASMGLEISSGVTIAHLIYNSEHCGFFGGFGWGILMIFATVISEFIYNKKYIMILPVGLVLIFLGITLHIFEVQISMRSMTASYILISLGFTSLILLIFIWIYETRKLTKGKSPILQILGRNAIVLYLFHGIVIGICYGVLELDSPVIFPILFGFLNIIVTYAMAFAMNKYHVYIKF